MILPGTLVQYIGEVPGHPCRPLGVYTVRNSYTSGSCMTCGGWGVSAINLQEILTPKTFRGRAVDGMCMCSFRIIAPPITEADRLEASAPDAPAKPKRVRA